MIGRGKRRAVVLALVAFAIWPLVQFSLTQRYAIDPWKFAGWAMYTVPGFMPRVDAFLLRDSGRSAVALGSTEYAAVGAERERMLLQSRYWGALADFEPLAREIRRAAGAEAPIEIVVTRYYVDPKSARLTAERTSHFYAPGEPKLRGRR